MRRSRPSIICQSLICMIAWACESPTGIPFPAEARRFAPPSIYREWWARTEACFGRTGSFNDVSWYVIPNVETLPGTDGVNGVWYPPGNRIVLAGAAVSWGDLVRHEMLHALLGPHAVGHPRDAFVARCGGVVVCNEVCVADGGPATQPSTAARVIAPSALDVTVEVTPSTPGEAAWDGYFMMIVKARNPERHAVIAPLPFREPGQTKGTFTYRIEGTGLFETYDIGIDVAEVARFGAGETKQFIFDFHIGATQDRYGLPAGTYTFRGGFDNVWAAHPPTVTVGP
jgi:hypothetical protein